MQRINDRPITQFSSIHQNKFVKIIKDQNILYLEENSKINQNLKIQKLTNLFAE